MARETAILLANGALRHVQGKTAHGLIRGPSRYRLLAVVDPSCAGLDAGAVLDGVHRDLPVVPSVGSFLEARGQGDLRGPGPDACVVGVATAGGVIPRELRGDLMVAARAGLDLINGLHQGLASDPEISSAAQSAGGRIVDLRRPRDPAELRFWTGEALDLKMPRVAVLGTDCALGKRTTTVRLLAACREAGVRTQLVATGQTGWLQGFDHGLLFDATPNDFVCGELERALLSAASDGDPELILIEGQSALRNPSGPCGAEMLLATGAKWAVLQHAPGRAYYDGFEDRKLPIGSLRDEVRLIEAYGARVLAVTVHTEGLDPDGVVAACAEVEASLGVPAVHPLEDAAIVQVASAVLAAVGCSA